MNQQRKLVKSARKEIITIFKAIIEDVKMKEVQQLKLEEILSDVNQGAVPDFGFLDELKYNDKQVGWHLFEGVIGPYPKY